jgi:hypothetical protein
MPVLSNCTIKNLHVYLSGYAGSPSASYQFIVRKNAVNTNIALTITGLSMDGISPNGLSEIFVEGDFLSIAVIPSTGTQPSDCLNVRWTLMVE